MRTSEFREALKELGFEVRMVGSERILINKRYGIETFASVLKNKKWGLDTDFNDFYNLEETKQGELFSILTTYASTPIAEREEEKRYRLKLINKMVDENVSYLNKIKKKEQYFISSNIHFVEGVQTIFTESELKYIDETSFKRVEVEQ